MQHTSLFTEFHLKTTLGEKKNKKKLLFLKLTDLSCVDHSSPCAQILTPPVCTRDMQLQVTVLLLHHPNLLF